MFRVVIGTERNGSVAPITVEIEGCPSSGIEAIDFRRKHGLPEAPSNKIVLPGFAHESEAFCRNHPDQCNGEADIITEHYGEYCFACNGVGEVYQSSGRRNAEGHQGSHLSVQPAAIRSYLGELNPGTAQALLLDIWAMKERSKVAAEAEAAKMRVEKEAKEAKLAEARELLKQDLAERDRLKAQVARLEATLKEYEDGEEEEDEEAA